MSVLPMFPLGTALLPYGVLPLHVFEPRYRAMTRAVLDGDREFGVVLIERGSEVGGGDVRTTLGTVARVVQAAELPDGRWQVVAVGTPRRFRVVHWLTDDPFPRADIDELVDAPVDAAECASLLDDVIPRIRRLLAMRAEAGEPSVPVDVELERDPAVATWQAALLTGMGPLDAHAVLALDDVPARLRRIAAAIDEQIDTLTFRLQGYRE